MSGAAWHDIDEIADPQLRIASTLLDADSFAAMNGQLSLANPLVDRPRVRD
ncbi:hypothetical protein [Streptomyces sp. NBC_00122]|uniref:hypothetical protein n=1 Tax=Streptomyces sp. NBC_00122 TaxID=2903623 RepID=UPI0032467D1E